jgi:membrane protein YdbS with pleckstrin-like domain
MKREIDLKKLWSAQGAPAPDRADLLLRIRKIRNRGLRSILWANICLIVTSAFIVGVWIIFQPQFLSTKLGIIIVIVAMLMFLFFQNKSIRFYRDADSAQTNGEYLNALLKIKLRQRFVQHTVLSAYFALLSVGLWLYLYEYTSRMKPLWAIVAYGITTLWMAFNWFYIRPRQIRKSESKIDGVINGLQNIMKQQ